MNQPLVSVIIPVYNMEGFLQETLQSVLASSYPNFEVIVMDDGSKDGSLEVARRIAATDSRVKVCSQANAGVSAARNNAIKQAQGTFILPVDADNLIEPTFIAHAVKAILTDDEVKVVAPQADFFGDRTGLWNLPPFSIHLLARKNIMDTCALYRKADWERAGGYCETIIAREDWEFWISVLKDGGKVVRLPNVELHYRIRKTSKRVSDRLLKKHVIDTLNSRHPEFFERELGGRLHYHRTWSRLLNRLHRISHPRKYEVSPQFSQLTGYVKTLPIHFPQEGKVIHAGRNTLKEIQIGESTYVVKAFAQPRLPNSVVYGWLRPSKAERSYRYAGMLRQAGIGSPEPAAYYTQRNGLLFGKSYYVSVKSACTHTYADLMNDDFPEEDRVLTAIAETTARMHQHGYLHKDYSRGNILFRVTAQGVEVEIIDLNRIRFRTINMAEGCKNFQRLPATSRMLEVMARAYAAARGYDAAQCVQLIKEFHKGH